jgi:dienelactone hydrolase
LDEPLTRSLEVPRTARHHLLDGGGETREAWFLLHGYAQLARPFLDSARALARPGRLLVAPEALSRFYLRRGTGEVGASWMTSVERASDIRDTLRHLDRVHAHAWAERGLREGLATTVLGFSQGGAAAARWAVLGETPVERVVSWGCQLPPDLDVAAAPERVRTLRWTFVFGDDDRAIDRGQWEEGLERLRAAGVEPEVVRYAGGHELVGDVLAGL